MHFQTHPKFIVHIIVVTKELTKNFISILLIRNSYPFDLLKNNSETIGKTAEFKKEKRVNFKL